MWEGEGTYKRIYCIFLKVEAIPDPSLPVEAILRRCNRLQVTNIQSNSCVCGSETPYFFQVMEFYGIPEFDDVKEFLCHLAKRQGKLRKGEAASALLIFLM